jgi:hypothetical protein
MVGGLFRWRDAEPAMVRVKFGTHELVDKFVETVFVTIGPFSPEAPNRARSRQHPRTVVLNVRETEPD